MKTPNASHDRVLSVDGGAEILCKSNIGITESILRTPNLRISTLQFMHTSFSTSRTCDVQRSPVGSNAGFVAVRFGATARPDETDALVARHGYGSAMLDEAELARLLGAMAEGDRGAAHTLYGLIGGRIYGIANRILRDASLAEDAAHQA